MPLKPFRQAANIDELARSTFLLIAACIFTRDDGQSGKPDSMVSPLLLVCEGKAGYMFKTHPGQAYLDRKSVV